MIRLWRSSGQILSSLLHRARWLAESLARGFLESTARPVLRWALAIEISYLVAAGLAIVAAAFLLSALSSGIAELGLPVWAAHLIVAAVAAGVAFVFYRRGSRRSLKEEFLEQDKAPESEEEEKELTVRIVGGPPRRSPRSRVFDVHEAAARAGWELTSRAPRVRRSFKTKEEAVVEARRHASQAPRGRVVVHKRGGAVQDVHRYGNGS